MRVGRVEGHLQLHGDAHPERLPVQRRLADEAGQKVVQLNPEIIN